MFEYMLNTSVTMAYNLSTCNNGLSALSHNSVYKEFKVIKDKTQSSESANRFNFLGVNLAAKMPYELAVTEMAQNERLKQDQRVFTCDIDACLVYLKHLWNVQSFVTIIQCIR